MKKIITVIFCIFILVACTNTSEKNDGEFDKNGIHKNTKTLYDNYGFDVNGKHKNHEFTKSEVKTTPIFFDTKYEKNVYLSNQNDIKKVYEKEKIYPLKNRLELLKIGKDVKNNINKIKNSKTEFETNLDIYRKNKLEIEKIINVKNNLYWYSLGNVQYNLENEEYNVYFDTKTKDGIEEKKYSTYSNAFRKDIKVLKYYKRGSFVTLNLTQKGLDYSGKENYKNEHIKIEIPISSNIAKQYPTKNLKLDLLLMLNKVDEVDFFRSAKKIGDSEWDEKYTDITYSIIGYRLKYNNEIIKEEIFLKGYYDYINKSEKKFFNK